MRMTSLAAIMVIAASTAMAQGTTSPGTTTSPSTAPSTAPSAAPSTSTTTTTTTMEKQSVTGQFYTRQAGEVRGSSLIGATVRNDQNDSIGEINELILNKDGQVVAAVIGVGGFLGIGEREVAVDFKSLKIEQDANAATNRGSVIVKMAATKDTLKGAPAWSWGDRGSATGTGATKPVAK